MPNTGGRLGDLERQVMEQLWQSPEGATVREVHRALSEDREIAYTTVMTVLDRLAKKEIVSREREGRAWRYTAAHSRDSLSAERMRDVVHRLESDRLAVMLHFLDDATPQEIDELKTALTELEERHAAAPQGKSGGPFRRWRR